MSVADRENIMFTEKYPFIYNIIATQYTFFTLQITKKNQMKQQINEERCCFVDNGIIGNIEVYSTLIHNLLYTAIKNI